MVEADGRFGAFRSVLENESREKEAAAEEVYGKGVKDTAFDERSRM